jgi:hypothetical protein
VVSVGGQWGNLFHRIELTENKNYSFISGRTTGVIIKSGGIRLPVRPTLILKDNIKTGLQEIRSENVD